MGKSKDWLRKVLLIVSNQSGTLNLYGNRVVKKFFGLPNEIFALGLSSQEISVYAYLLYCEDRKTYTCYPSYKTIGQALKLSRKTVMKYVHGLEEKKLITTEPTKVTLKSGRKQNGNLLFTIRPIQEAVDYYYERQLAKAEKEYQIQLAQRRLEEYDRKHPKKAM